MGIPGPASETRIKAARLLLEEFRSKEPSDVRKRFISRYWDRPDLFVAECIEWKLKDSHAASYQNDIMLSLVKNRRAAVRGPHGLGKTALASWLILWFALTRDGVTDWKIPTTASAWRQLERFLWPEIHKWARRLKWDVIGRAPLNATELLGMSLKMGTGESFAIASDNAELIEGAHASWLFYVFDEAKAIPEPTWDAAEGAFSTGNCFALAISTPGELSGRFYKIHRREEGFEDWWVRRVTRAEAIAAGRMSERWANDRKRQWGEKSAVYQNRVEGEFAASDADGVIALADVERAIQRWQERNDRNEWPDLERLGVDIGRGGDASVIARRHGNAIRSLDQFTEKDIMPIAGRVAGILNVMTKAQAVIDVIGIGAGVVDRLREFNGLRGRVLAFNAAEKTSHLDKTKELGFVNERAAAWWTLRELLQDDLIDLPPNDLMIGELTAPHYWVVSGGKIQIEAKGDIVTSENVKMKGIRARLGRSTNYADAIAMAFWYRSGGASLESIQIWGKGVEMSSVSAEFQLYANGQLGLKQAEEMLYGRHEIVERKDEPDDPTPRG